ncbi:MAG: DUF2304 domain-containing protein [Candidatus Moranbacteria bacterium]|nr:DUF2304 domain-containing protein [Candidatus Moranbacteria bacterium]
MSLHLYQIVIAIIAIFMIYQGIDNYIKGKHHPTILKLLVRVVVWGGMAAVALFPMITVTLAKIIGIEGNLNAVILTGFILVFLMIFKLLSAIERVESQLSDVVRNDALKNLETRNPKPKTRRKE